MKHSQITGIDRDKFVIEQGGKLGKHRGFENRIRVETRKR